MQQRHTRTGRQWISVHRFVGIVRTTIAFRLLLIDTAKKMMEDNKKDYLEYLENEKVQTDMGILTNADKALFNKPHEFRTVEERQHLLQLIANQPIFKRLPPKVRARLSRVLRLISIGPARKLIEQGHEPFTLYFVMSGELVVRSRTFDIYKGTPIMKFEHVTCTGDWIGEVEFLENCMRRYSYTSRTDVDLLAIDYEDFDRLLRPHLSPMWNNKKTTLKNIGYFDHFTEGQLITACHLSTIRQFPPLETIFQGPNTASGAYFVVSGECMILQRLKMKLTKVGKTDHYELLEEDDEPVFQELSGTENMKLFRQESLAPIRTQHFLDDDLLSEDEMEEKINRKAQKVNARLVEEKCGLRQSILSKPHRNSSRVSTISTKSKRSHKLHVSEPDEFHIIAEGEDPSLSSSYNSDSWSVEYEEEWIKKIVSDSEVTTESSAYAGQKNDIDPARIEMKFIDVGSIITGGIFGLGESMQNRVIIARTSVSCLLLPRFWLLKAAQNKSNIWQRRRFYLEQNIPPKKELFKNYLKTRAFDVRCRQIVNNAIKDVNRCNVTKRQDIPIMGRILQMDDAL